MFGPPVLSKLVAAAMFGLRDGSWGGVSNSMCEIQLNISSEKVLFTNLINDCFSETLSSDTIY